MGAPWCLAPPPAHPPFHPHYVHCLGAPTPAGTASLRLSCLLPALSSLHRWKELPRRWLHLPPAHVKVKVTQSCPTLCNASDRPWSSPGQNTGVGSLFLLQVIFPIQESNWGLLHCRRILYQLSHKGSPEILEWVACPFSRGSSPQGSSRGLLHCRQALLRKCRHLQLFPGPAAPTPTPSHLEPLLPPPRPPHASFPPQAVLEAFLGGRYHFCWDAFSSLAAKWWPPPTPCAPHRGGLFSCSGRAPIL